MKVHLFYTGWIAKDHKSFTTGGVQTYLINLASIFAEEGYEFHYYRASDVNNDTIIQGIHVHEIVCRSKKDRIRIKKTFQHFKHLIDKEKDIVLFADDYLSAPALDYHSLSIQHGIFWDIPNETSQKPLPFFLSFLRKGVEAWKRMLHVKNVKMMVCVDYNFNNWFRAVFPYMVVKTRVIPNFTHIMPPIEKPADRINIIFARRFEIARGTRVFGKAIKRILNEFNHVYVTLAGRGSDSQWLHQEFDGVERIEFTQYEAHQSLQFHQDKHIAVIPTVGSEGTSLSLLEAMSAQCAVVASDVGGITNVLINGYNGLIVPSGDTDGLYESIKFLIENPQERNRLAENAYNIVSNSFSFDRWRSEWKDVIKTIRQL